MKNELPARTSDEWSLTVQPVNAIGSSGIGTTLKEAADETATTRTPEASKPVPFASNKVAGKISAVKMGAKSSLLP